MGARPLIDGLEAAVYVIPTERPESDGTLEWDRTTLVRVEARAAGRRGLGWTYGAAAAAAIVRDLLRGVVVGRDACDVGGAAAAMARALRNVGWGGVAAMAASAVDLALWDLKARVLEVSLVDLLGAARAAVPVYGSGGFTSYSDEELRAQLGGWAAAGFARVKMKVGRQPERDRARVRVARAAIDEAARGRAVELFVDANGAYERKQALALGRAFAEEGGVRWFEEPVSSDDLVGLAALARALPMDVAAGEYGWDARYFRRMLEAGAVDVLQADVTRCGGITGFLEAAALCDAWGLPLSTHCAPSLHAAVACAASRLVHVEWFHDHVRIERELLDGFVEPVDGLLRPPRDVRGHGYVWKERDAERYRS